MNAQNGQIIPTGFSDGIWGPDLASTTVAASENVASAGGDSLPASDNTVNPTASALSAKSALVYLGVIIVILILLRFMRDDERTEKKEDLLPVNVYNVLIITGSAIVGLAIVKIAVNKYNVPGLTTLVNTI